MIINISEKDLHIIDSMVITYREKYNILFRRIITILQRYNINDIIIHNKISYLLDQTLNYNFSISSINNTNLFLYGKLSNCNVWLDSNPLYWDSNEIKIKHDILTLRKLKIQKLKNLPVDDLLEKIIIDNELIEKLI